MLKDVIPVSAAVDWQCFICLSNIENRFKCISRQKYNYKNERTF